ncbi:MAG: 2Fe-2S iron-sulfur cluster-binding protein [Thermodesulfobacteriota bacterium]|nr:2Fe-2S iron-sulfur cluster-binding protein [Thermodesulfobacteriota bacterium]
MEKINITIDGRKIKAERGEKVLGAALKNGIYIPNLCAVEEAATTPASCRLCFVEIAGRKETVTACTENVTEGMEVYTNTEEVIRLRKQAFALLMASHRVECKTCHKNKSCELQNMAKFLKVSLVPKKLKQIHKTLPLNSSHPHFSYDPGKCILCGRCVLVCHEVIKKRILNFAYRGIKTVITISPSENYECSSCLKCVNICPAGSLIPKIK